MPGTGCMPPYLTHSARPPSFHPFQPRTDHIITRPQIWSIGASCDSAGRAKFNEFLRKLLDHGVDRKPSR